MRKSVLLVKFQLPTCGDLPDDMVMNFKVLLNLLPGEPGFDKKPSRWSCLAPSTRSITNLLLGSSQAQTFRQGDIMLEICASHIGQQPAALAD